MLNNHPFKHWVPPKMPPRFSLNTDLTLGVNARTLSSEIPAHVKGSLWM